MAGGVIPRTAARIVGRGSNAAATGVLPSIERARPGTARTRLAQRFEESGRSFSIAMLEQRVNLNTAPSTPIGTGHSGAAWIVPGTRGADEPFMPDTGDTYLGTGLRTGTAPPISMVGPADNIGFRVHSPGLYRLWIEARLLDVITPDPETPLWLGLHVVPHYGGPLTESMVSLVAPQLWPRTTPFGTQRFITTTERILGLPGPGGLGSSSGIDFSASVYPNPLGTIGRVLSTWPLRVSATLEWVSETDPSVVPGWTEALHVPPDAVTWP